jgi:hypothetical protein
MKLSPVNRPSSSRDRSAVFPNSLRKSLHPLRRSSSASRVNRTMSLFFWELGLLGEFQHRQIETWGHHVQELDAMRIERHIVDLAGLVVSLSTGLVHQCVVGGFDAFEFVWPPVSGWALRALSR